MLTIKPGTCIKKVNNCAEVHNIITKRFFEGNDSFCMYTSQLIGRTCHLTPGIDDDYGKSWIRSTRVGLRIQCVMPGGNPNQRNEEGWKVCAGREEWVRRASSWWSRGSRVIGVSERVWRRRGLEEGWISLWLVMSVWLSAARCTSMECKIKYKFCLTDAHL